MQCVRAVYFEKKKKSKTAGKKLISMKDRDREREIEIEGVLCRVRMKFFIFVYFRDKCFGLKPLDTCTLCYNMQMWLFNMNIIQSTIDDVHRR